MLSTTVVSVEFKNQLARFPAPACRLGQMTDWRTLGSFSESRNILKEANLEHVPDLTLFWPCVAISALLSRVEQPT